MRLFLFLAPVALAACDREEAPPAPRDELATSVPVATPPASVADPAPPAMNLAGEYRVAGVGGRDIDLPYAITASISADRIHLVADCVNLAWSYRFAGGALATERVAVEGCGRGLTAEEEALVAAFDGATAVSRLPSGAFEFTGSGPAATLFTQ